MRAIGSIASSTSSARPSEAEMPAPHIVTLPEAARLFGKTQATVRWYIRQGAPCARPGGSGPGTAALVDVDAMRAWLERRRRGAKDAPPAELDSAALAAGLLAAVRSSDSIRITQRQRAALMLSAYLEVTRRITGRPPEPPHPPEIDVLLAIARNR